MKKILLLCLMSTLLLTVKALNLNGLSVVTGSSAVNLLINEISDITFGNTEMSINLLDGTVVTFANSEGWKITLLDDFNGIGAVGIEDADLPATIYDTNGRVVTEIPSLSQLSLSSLPKGVFIIKSGNKCFKIQR